MDLKNVSTKELVDELATIDNKEIKGGGPVVIFRIWD